MNGERGRDDAAPGTPPACRLSPHREASPHASVLTPPREALRVAIIGGGYAGMAAAVTLAEAGVAVTIYEANATPGGRARRVEIGGLPLDNGMHILLGAYTETLALMRTVGVDPEAALMRLPLDWHIHGEFRFAAAPLPAPLHLAAGLLRTRGAPWRERWAAARFLARMRRARYQLARDLTVARLLHENGQGPRFVRHLWEPLCLAALNTPIERASAQVFLNVLRDGLDAGRSAGDVLLARRDLSALFPEPAARFVRERGGVVRLRTAIRRMENIGNGFLLHGDGFAADHTHVVCAASPHHVAALMDGLPAMAQLQAAMRAIAYEPICTVYLQYAPEVRLPQPMLGLSGRTAHWLFDRGRICGQPGLVAAIVSAGGPHAHLAHGELAQRMNDDVTHVLGVTHAPRLQQVIAEKRATFAATPGLQRPAMRTPLPGLLLAGDYIAGDYPATLEGAVRSGIACARAVLG